MKKFFPYLILFSAILISVTGSFFSIYGLGKLFGGHQLGATIIAFSFEFGNIVTAASLKYFWKFLPPFLKYPLIVVVLILTLITSMGLYGYLSDGYQKTAMKDEIVQRRSGLVKLKKDNFQLRIDDYKKELDGVNNSISTLTTGLNTNSQTQQVIKGQVVTNVQVTSKKGIENQLSISNDRKLTLNSKIEGLQDSVQRLELEMIEIEANNSNASELGPLKYLAELTGSPMNKIVNWLILMIVIVFQPLAIMLILVSMFAFKNNHYLTRDSKKPRTPKVKDKSLIQPDEIKEMTLNTTEEPQVKPKRKYNRKPKGQTTKVKENVVIPVINETEENESNEELVNLEETEKKRKVVDTNLTSDLADHISKSLQNKKKV